MKKLEKDELLAAYRELGFATIPLVPRGKRPIRKGWLTRGDAQWEGAPPDANFGILTGARSGGLVVLDFDTRDGPERVLGMTPEQLAIVTIVVETARGWHVYARAEGVASGTPRAGLDLRGEGGMVVAPPSVHPSGHVYTFVGASRGIVQLEAIAPRPLLDPGGNAPTVLELDEVEAWIAVQAPKLQEAWRRLKDPPSVSFDASKADFAVARCLWEGGWDADETVAVLMVLPGSRARERGEAYARLTAARAAAARGSAHSGRRPVGTP
ncbi:MAG: bifunctional DNA primase/polymerase [Candidatus Thermoplasmatota archaeon]